MIPKTNKQLMIQQGLSLSTSALILLVTWSTTIEASADAQDDITTYTTPYDSGTGEKAFLALIEKAKYKIRMIAYGYTDPDVNDALLAAKKRGVDIEVCMDSTQAAGGHQKPLVAELVKAKIPVWIGKSAVHDQLIHCKATIFDDDVVEAGSWNYSPSASQQDNFLDIIKSKQRAKLFDAFFEKIKAKIQERMK